MSLPKGLRANYSYQTNTATFGILREVGDYLGRTGAGLAKGAKDLGNSGFNKLSGAVTAVGETAANKGSNLANNVSKLNNPQGFVGSVGKGLSDNLSGAGSVLQNNADAITKGGLTALGAGGVAGAGALGARALDERRQNQQQFAFAASPTTADFFVKKVASKAVDLAEGGLDKLAMRGAKKASSQADKALDQARTSGVNIGKSRKAARQAQSNINTVAATSRRDKARSLVKGAGIAGGAAGAGAVGLAALKNKEDEADFSMRSFYKAVASGATFDRKN